MDGQKLSPVISYLNGLGTEQLRRVCKASGLGHSGNRRELLKRLRRHADTLHFGACGPESIFSAESVPVFYDCFIVIDFECTCWEDEKSKTRSPPDFRRARQRFLGGGDEDERHALRDYFSSLRDPRVREIIEFPAVLVDCETMRVIDQFHSYVRPVYHPRLSSFCTQLTGIEQHTVDAAPTFPEVFRAFEKWFRKTTANKRFAFVADGPVDFGTFLFGQCQISGIVFPKYVQRWVNLKTIFSNFFDTGRMKLAEMVNFLGLNMEGRLHSGIDDARNIASILVQLVHEGALVYANEMLLTPDVRNVRHSPRIIQIQRKDFLRSKVAVRAYADRCQTVRSDGTPLSSKENKKKDHGPGDKQRRTNGGRNAANSRGKREHVYRDSSFPALPSDNTSCMTLMYDFSSEFGGKR
jgi:3'-5' exoribonuclease 1